jgi:hypothetical protein
MTSHAPSIQPAAAPHHVNPGLALLLSGAAVIAVAVAVLLSGAVVPTSAPTSLSGVDEALIAHRASERESAYAAVPGIPLPVVRANIYYSAASAMSGVHGPVSPIMPSVYYSAASAGSGVHGPAVPIAPSAYYSAASALSGIQVDNER